MNAEAEIVKLYKDVNISIFFGSKFSSRGKWDIEVKTENKSFSFSGFTINEALQKVWKELQK